MRNMEGLLGGWMDEGVSRKWEITMGMEYANTHNACSSDPDMRGRALTKDNYN